ncbi:SH3 domain containing protein [Acanthamoeba castellanii str. Neff]|uniref:SH3 domain containing protein n=1 Tax=Acanthamoeba castellanii (strain ATCC 30010 / Neff) TaxID=1257118 RepID=L8GLJ2_ACACF|nr:SH3 domain containing protein [Acanthamoeba castellanii str. Neff]ELR13568.1 SH3 domain containing protein [Acanthamoeba castellanii str. Neff]
MAAAPPSFVPSGSGTSALLSPRPSPRLSYEQELWGGLELAEKRVEEGRKTYREVQSFIEEMIDLELSYVKGFKKLSARQSQCTEGGTLGSAWQAFRKYLHINADMHALLMEHWRKASFALQDHCAQQTKATINYFAEATKLNKEREKGLAEVMRAELAKQQYEGAQNDSSIATTKLVKLNAILQTLLKECETSEKLYGKAVEDFNAAQEQHVQETKKILHALEAMEESRIVTMKSIFEEGCMTWGGSFTHQPEALGAVQKIIKNIDSQKDIQNWILSNRTGQSLPAPLAVEPWQPASKFRRDRSSSGNSVRFKFKPEGVGTVIVSTTSGVVPTANSPPIKRTREEAKKEEAEKEKTAERDEPTEKRFPRVQVLYPYEAEEEGELSINAGDIITVLEIEEEGWWKGEIDGRVGSFPSNYVRPLSTTSTSASPSTSSDSFSAIVSNDDSDFSSDSKGKTPQQARGAPPSGRSLADFRSSVDDLASPPLSPSSSYTALSTSSPSLLTFLEQQKQQPSSALPSPGSSPGVRGSECKRGGKLVRTGGQRRIVKDDDMEDDDVDTTANSGGGGGDGGGNGALERPTLGTLPIPIPATLSLSPQATPPTAVATVDEPGFECVVLFDFEAENEDELTIRVGEMLRVTEEVEQWYVGVYPDGRTGMFPSNYVQRTDGL